MDFFENKSYEPIEDTNASDVDLITIGRALKSSFDETFPEDCVIRRVIIENQISPIANRMKTLQGMIAQYFISKDKPVIGLLHIFITHISRSAQTPNFQCSVAVINVCFSLYNATKFL